MQSAILLAKIALPCLVRWILSLSSRRWSASSIPWSYNLKPCHQHQLCNQLLTCPVSALLLISPHWQDWGNIIWAPMPMILAIYLLLLFCFIIELLWATQSKSWYKSLLLNALALNKLNSVNVTFELCIYIKDLLVCKQSTSLVCAYQIHRRERIQGCMLKFDVMGALWTDIYQQ